MYSNEAERGSEDKYNYFKLKENIWNLGLNKNISAFYGLKNDNTVTSELLSKGYIIICRWQNKKTIMVKYQKKPLQKLIKPRWGLYSIIIYHIFIWHTSLLFIIWVRLYYKATSN